FFIPELKKASKRVSCAKRYKIQKKVREHNRKLRKEAKKKGINKRPKKDLGVPSSAPFREEVLREAEQRRLQNEEEKEKRKQAKKEERAQKRKKEKEGATKEAEPKVKKARKVNSQLHDVSMVIDASDVLIEVLDARDPLGCRCPQLEETVLQKNKKLIFLLNKIDLIPKDNADKWLKCLQKEFPVVAFKASTQIQDKTMVSLIKRAACFGQDCLSNLLTSFYTTSNREGAFKVGLVGFPNVGKSSVINSVKGVLACNAGVKRGITKSMQEVHILKNINLVDSPGIVAQDSNPAPALALRSLRVEEGLESELQAATTLLKHCDKTQVMLQYTVPDYRSPLEFLTMFAKKRGFLQKGGVANTEQAAAAFLADWTGSVQRINARSCFFVAVKFPNPASSISFTSRGPTAGLLQVTEIRVKEQEPKEEEEDGEADEKEEDEEVKEFM
uniref:Guanine nucleotide-binding protein-like 3 n=1 Tax=Periophthalmus magnuspinnatus TaxID=409849 RepID=A0A3B3ZYU1_9GOBI